MNNNFNMSKIYMNKLETKIKDLQARIDNTIEYINKHLVVDSYSPLYDEETKILDDEFGYEDLLDILKGSDSNGHNKE